MSSSIPTMGTGGGIIAPIITVPRAGWTPRSMMRGGFRPYVNSAYMNGAVFLEEMRVQMGDRDFFNFLKDYATRFSYKRATGDDFFAVARENTDANLNYLIGTYFKGGY